MQTGTLIIDLMFDAHGWELLSELGHGDEVLGGLCPGND